MHDVLFWFFAAVIAVGSLLTVTLKNLLHAAIAFMGSLLGIAALFLLMQQEFVALMQVMVYVGGVVIFVVYTILLTTRLGDAYTLPGRRKVLVALLCALVVTGVLLAFVGEQPEEYVPPEPGIDEIGHRLLSTGYAGYLIPFELISVLLLAALIGAATIAQKSRLGAANDEAGEEV